MIIGVKPLYKNHYIITFHIRYVELVKRRWQKIKPVGTFLQCFLESKHAVQKKGYSMLAQPKVCFHYSNTSMGLSSILRRDCSVSGHFVKCKCWFRSSLLSKWEEVLFTGFVAASGYCSHFIHKWHEKRIPAPWEKKQKKKKKENPSSLWTWIFHVCV